ncbi:U4/U6.U5 SMALL NUCLEAR RIBONUCLEOPROTEIN 27 KDA PROTEIN [Salix viminalis]|uniref:U4/U6.U5 SMALL NUCLEAR RIBONUCLEOPROTEIN 27 kDa PROTEIN n=1 Tax=Salix viminalis TaxID=40686 RepID=A0A9Q0ZQ72_SALVM|nr:U4/U6.U5 SMALL NUCLEAR RIBONUCLEOPROTEIN 27 KDA PROTEIN [Salix viminalis]
MGDRDRPRYRDRERRRDKEDRTRSTRSRSPDCNRSKHTRSPDRSNSERVEKKESDNNDNAGVGEGGGLMDEDEIEMMKQLGIPTGFDSTKGKPVPGADVTKRQPRQYMNRRGGFNRPLPLEQNR